MMYILEAVYRLPHTAAVAPDCFSRNAASAPIGTMKYKGVYEQTSATGKVKYNMMCWQPAPEQRLRTVGTYYNAEEAARAYDLAVLALGVQGRQMNFHQGAYSADQIKAMKSHLSKPPNSKLSNLMGVRAKQGQWEATIGKVPKRVHLGCYETEQDAAVQYDLAQLVLHELDAAVCADKLNFDWSDVPVEQINSLTTNVRLRISKKLGPDIIEQQLQLQEQQAEKGKEKEKKQLQQQEQHQHSSDQGIQQGRDQQQQVQQPTALAQRPQPQQEGQQQTVNDHTAYKLAKQQAKQQLQEARAALLQAKQRSQQQLSKKKRQAAAAAKKAARAAVKAAKQHFKDVKQRQAVLCGGIYD